MTKGAKNVLIDKCKLDHSRRQGISIISAHRIKVRNCIIENVGGTSPEYAIDVEPNDHDTVGTVFIEKVVVNSCKGGFASYGYAKNAMIDSITIKNCTINHTVHTPMTFNGTRNTIIKGCKVNKYRGKTVLELNDLNKVSIKNITIDGKEKIKDSDMGSFISSRNDNYQIVK